MYKQPCIILLRNYTFKNKTNYKVLSNLIFQRFSEIVHGILCKCCLNVSYHFLKISKDFRERSKDVSIIKQHVFIRAKMVANVKALISLLFIDFFTLLSGLEKSPLWLSGTSGFLCQTSNFPHSLARWARIWTSCS